MGDADKINTPRIIKNSWNMPAISVAQNLEGVTTPTVTSGRDVLTPSLSTEKGFKETTGAAAGIEPNWSIPRLYADTVDLMLEEKLKTAREVAKTAPNTISRTESQLPVKLSLACSAAAVAPHSLEELDPPPHRRSKWKPRRGVQVEDITLALNQSQRAASMPPAYRIPGEFPATASAKTPSSKKHIKFSGLSLFRRNREMVRKKSGDIELLETGEFAGKSVDASAKSLAEANTCNTCIEHEVIQPKTSVTQRRVKPLGANKGESPQDSSPKAKALRDKTSTTYTNGIKYAVHVQVKPDAN